MMTRSWKKYVIALCLFAASTPTFALSIDITQLMVNIGTLATIVQDISIMIGLMLFLAGMFRLKRYGEMRTFMSHQMTIARPLMMLLAGVCLLALPVVIRTGLLAIWNADNPLPYQGDAWSWDALIPPIIMFVRLIGVCAFIRGIVLFGRGGGVSTQPGLYGKAFLHVIGGLFCIHIIGTYYLLKDILAFS